MQIYIIHIYIEYYIHRILYTHKYIYPYVYREYYIQRYPYIYIYTHIHIHIHIYIDTYPSRLVTTITRAASLSHPVHIRSSADDVLADSWMQRTVCDRCVGLNLG